MLIIQVVSDLVAVGSGKNYRRCVYQLLTIDMKLWETILH